MIESQLPVLWLPELIVIIVHVGSRLGICESGTDQLYITIPKYFEGMISKGRPHLVG